MRNQSSDIGRNVSAKARRGEAQDNALSAANLSNADTYQDMSVFEAPQPGLGSESGRLKTAAFRGPCSLSARTGRSFPDSSHLHSSPHSISSIRMESASLFQQR